MQAIDKVISELREHARTLACHRDALLDKSRYLSAACADMRREEVVGAIDVCRRIRRESRRKAGR